MLKLSLPKIKFLYADFVINFSILSLSFLVPQLFPLNTEEYQRKGGIITEQEPIVASQDRPLDHVLHLPLIWRKNSNLLSLLKFQEVNLIREVRKCRNKGKQPSKTK